MCEEEEREKVVNGGIRGWKHPQVKLDKAA